MMNIGWYLEEARNNTVVKSPEAKNEFYAGRDIPANSKKQPPRRYPRGCKIRKSYRTIIQKCLPEALQHFDVVGPLVSSRIAYGLIAHAALHLLDG